MSFLFLFKLKRRIFFSERKKEKERKTWELAALSSGSWTKYSRLFCQAEKIDRHLLDIVTSGQVLSVLSEEKCPQQQYDDNGCQQKQCCLFVCLFVLVF